MNQYLIIIEKAGDNYSAYSPDLSGCVATGKDRDQAKKNMQEAIALHLEGLREDHLAVPEAKATAEYVSVA